MSLLFATDAPVLRLRYETEGLLAATDLANVLSEVGRGFDRYAKRASSRRGLQLAVQRVEAGSVVADFVIVGAALAMGAMRHPEALYGFVGFLGDLLAIAQGLRPGKNKPADQRMIEGLQRPVAEGGAQQVNIFVLGDGNTVTIDKNAIELIRTKNEAAQAAAKIDTAETLERPAPPMPPRFLTLKGKFGAVINVKGSWYVRLEGEGGVLNPLQLAPGVAVKDDQSYRFDGAWEGRSYHIRAAQPIG